jgi:tRNA A-37 threonylcarbamoyl transferase component Bud32
LEPVGDAIAEDETISENLCLKMKSALGRIHNAGYIHGDIARRNFCKKKIGKRTFVFLVDLEMCRLSQGQFEFDNEMRKVDGL